MYIRMYVCIHQRIYAAPFKELSERCDVARKSSASERLFLWCREM